MKKNIVLVIVVWLISIVSNISVSFFYPDTNISVFNLIVSILFLTVIGYSVFNFIRQQNFGIVLYIGIIGAVSGLLVSLFESMNTAQFITLPLYVLVITPLFGLNYLMNLNIALFSLVVLFIFIPIIMLQLYFKKQEYSYPR